MRIEVQFPDADPVGAMLSQLPRGQRSKIVRMVLHAAFLPGGWAQLVQGRLTVPDAGLPDSKSTPAPSAAEESGPTGAGMSAAGTKGFLAGLRQFGALDD